MARPIAHIDLWPANSRLERAFISRIGDWYRKGAFSGGEYVEAFERDFAAYLGAPACVGVNSGTSALHLALLALGIGPGDEVILPAYTFAGTGWGILYCGATPVFADVELETGNISASQVEKILTRRTRAIIVVHLFGQPADMASLKALARSRKIPIIEDAAQAHGARVDGKAAGSLGDIGCFSFYPTKNLGACGEGGALVTSRMSWAEKARRLRNHNCVTRYHHLGIGFNYRMEGIQGLFLGLKLPLLDAQNAERRDIARTYLESLRPGTVLPLCRDPEESAWHAFVCRVRSRSRFLQRLSEEGIGHAIYYPKILPELPPFRSGRSRKGRSSFPNAAELSRTTVSLPIYPGLPKRDVARVARVLAEWE